jgi:nucleoside-diphosphate-sugar epimerase
VAQSFIAGPDLGRALVAAGRRGQPGGTYLVAGFDAEWSGLIGAVAAALRVRPNVAGIPYDLAYIAATIRELRASNGQACWPNRYGIDVFAKAHLYDDSRSRRALTWSPQISTFEEGLAELMSWYRGLSPAPT